MGEQAARATKKQQKLLEFVGSFIAEHKYGPSYREIMNALEYKSVSTVAVHVEGLITKGFLRRADNSPRSLEVVGHDIKDGQELSAISTEDELAQKIDFLLAASKDEPENIAQVHTLIGALEILGYSKKAEVLRARIDS